MTARRRVLRRLQAAARETARRRAEEPGGAAQSVARTLLRGWEGESGGDAGPALAQGARGSKPATHGGAAGRANLEDRGVGDSDVADDGAGRDADPEDVRRAREELAAALARLSGQTRSGETDRR